MTTGRTNERVAGRGFVPGVAAAALLAAAASTSPALGQDRGEVTVDVERCLDMESAEERQACFGTEVDQALQGRGSAAAGAAAPDGDDRDGRSRERTPAASEQPAARAADEDADDVEYRGTIVEIEEYLPSAYIIRLDNGQIWEQTEPKRYPLRPGLEVRIYSTRWGSRYRLAGVDSGGHIQVRRVQ